MILFGDFFLDFWRSQQYTRLLFLFCPSANSQLFSLCQSTWVFSLATQYFYERMDIGQQVWSFQSCSVFGPAKEGKELQLTVGPRQQPAVDGCCGSRSWPWALDNSQLLVAVVGTVADHHNILTHQQSLLLFACSKMRLTLNSHFFISVLQFSKKLWILCTQCTQTNARKTAVFALIWWKILADFFKIAWSYRKQIFFWMMKFEANPWV